MCVVKLLGRPRPGQKPDIVTAIAQRRGPADLVSAVVAASPMGRPVMVNYHIAGFDIEVDNIIVGQISFDVRQNFSL